MWPLWWWPQRVDATAHVQVDGPQVEQFVQVLVALGHGVANVQRARIGQRAVIAAGADDHVGQQADVGQRQAQRAGRVVQRGQVALMHPGQHQVLLVRQARLARAELFGQLGQGVQGVGVGIARGKAGALERQGNGFEAGQLVAAHVLLQPALVQLALRIHLGGQVGGLQLGNHEMARDPVKLCLRDGVGRAVEVDDVLVFLLHRVDEFLAFALDQNLDAGLPLVVAPTVAVVGAYHGFDVVEHLVPRQKFAHHAANDGRAAHAAAHLHREAHAAVCRPGALAGQRRTSQWQRGLLRRR